MQNSDSNVILDASAFYSGIPFLGSLKCYTTSNVFEEIKHIKRSFDAIGLLVAGGNLQVRDPEARFMDAAKRIAKRSGDLVKMSEADLSVIALAFELKDSNPIIVTDDYAVANVAELSSIKVSYVMTRGIRRVGTWIKYCSACGVSYRAIEKQCNVCGNKLRSKLRESQKR